LDAQLFYDALPDDITYYNTEVDEQVELVIKEFDCIYLLRDQRRLRDIERNLDATLLKIENIPSSKDHRKRKEYCSGAELWRKTEVAKKHES